MDNFDLKKYLVENKLTYQEKMKDKAKKLKEESFINEEDETAAITAAEKVEDQVASSPNIKAEIDKLSDEEKMKLSAQLAKLGITPDSSVKSAAEKIAPKIGKVINEAEGDIKKKASNISNFLGQALVAQNAIPLLSLVIGRAINPAAPFTTGVGLTLAVGGALIGLAELLNKSIKSKKNEGTGKGTEQEKGHQAPKDKSKQGPSTMNEAEGKVKINFTKKAEFNDLNDKYDTKKGGKMSDEEELIMDAGTWNSEGFFAKKYDSLEDFAKFVEKTYGGNHKRHLSDLMKMKSKGIIKIETNESISLNEGKIFFGGY